MAFQNLNIFNEVAKHAIKEHGINLTHKVKLLQLSENATYLVCSRLSGQKYAVLRVSRPGYHTLAELESEIAWLNEINDYTPLVVAKPIADRQGKTIQSIRVGDSVFFCAMFEFLEGDAPDESKEERAIRQFEMLGETTAYLHRHTTIWNGTKRLNRMTWDFDTILGDQAAFGDWRLAEDLKGNTEGTEIIEKAIGIIKERLQRYGKNERNFGLIHADLRLSNLLIEENQIKVIDFDDCGFGWHLHDLASSVSFIEDKPIVPQLVNAWIQGYQKVLPFTDTDLEEVDTFILMRRIQLLAWLTSHSDSDPVKELSIGYADGTVKLAIDYMKRYSKR